MPPRPYVCSDFFFFATSLQIGLVLLNHRVHGRELRAKSLYRGEHCKEQKPPLLQLGLDFFFCPSTFHLYFYFLARNRFRRPPLSFFRGSSAAHDTGARLPAPTSSHLVIQDPGEKLAISSNNIRLQARIPPCNFKSHALIFTEFPHQEIPPALSHFSHIHLQISLVCSKQQGFAHFPTSSFVPFL